MTKSAFKINGAFSDNGPGLCGTVCSSRLWTVMPGRSPAFFMIVNVKGSSPWAHLGYQKFMYCLAVVKGLQACDLFTVRVKDSRLLIFDGSG